jgi:predicted kinase
MATFDQVRRFHANVLPRSVALEVERLTLRYLEGREPLFASRIERGFVVDGHETFAGDPAAHQRGLSAPVWTKRTYTEPLARVERLLSLGESVVVDASWTDQH